MYVYNRVQKNRICISLGLKIADLIMDKISHYSDVHLNLINKENRITKITKKVRMFISRIEWFPLQNR